MLERYLEQEEAVRTTLCMMDRNDLLIPSEKNSEPLEMVDVLRPFEVATREMSGEKYVCSSKIIPQQKLCNDATAVSAAGSVKHYVLRCLEDFSIWKPMF